MTKKLLADEASIYQLSLRVFTPEGTLRAAEKMLPMLADLGPKYLQLVALTVADDDEDRTYWSKRQIGSDTNNPKNSYRMKDYFHVDEEYGTDEDFRDFIKTAHKFGLRVILDLVYLHCGPKAVFLDEHPEFIQRDESGKIKLMGEWAFPRFDYSNMDVRDGLIWSTGSKNLTLMVSDAMWEMPSRLISGWRAQSASGQSGRTSSWSMKGAETNTLQRLM